MTSSNDNGVPPGAGGWKPSASAVAGRSVAPGSAGAAGTGYVPGVGPVPGAGVGGSGPQPSNVRAPSAPRDRKPALAALGLLLVVVGALASVYLQQQSKNRVGVVEITKRVPQGQVVGQGSISEVQVAVDPNVHYVTWQQATGGKMDGLTARTDLVPGTLLVGEMLTSTLPLAPGQEVVGLSLKDGEYPLGIQTGDTVSAYFVSNKNGDQTGQQYLTDGFTTTPIATGLRVYDVGADTTAGQLDISLVLPQQLANNVTQASSGGNLVLAFDKHTP
ncbi:MAG: hypothetical protein ACRDVE_10650 [Actinocrinis sp.]